MKTFEAIVYIENKRSQSYQEIPQKVQVQAKNSFEARQLMEAYGRVAGVPIQVD